MRKARLWDLRPGNRRRHPRYRQNPNFNLTVKGLGTLEIDQDPFMLEIRYTDDVPLETGLMEEKHFLKSGSIATHNSGVHH